jgi:hypothetical protein
VEGGCAAFERAMDRRSKRLLVEMLGLAKVANAIEEAPFPWASTGLVCLFLFIAAFAIVTIFGQNLRALFAASTELAGNVGPAPSDEEHQRQRQQIQGKKSLDKFNASNDGAH